MGCDNKELDVVDILSKNIYGILLTIVVIAVVSAAFAIFIYSTNFNGGLSNQHERWGTFGDFFGGTLNPIFGFLGLIALLITIVIQSRELKSSTMELARSAQALQEQSKTLEVQNFENTFFQMVRLHNDLVSGIDLRDKSGSITTQGRDCFKVFYKKRFLGFYSQKNTSLNNIPFLKIIQESYDEFFNNNQNEVGHYFRNLYTIIRFVDDSSSENKKLYIRIIRAQLSSFELALLFYNSLHNVGLRRFKPLIEKYELLENLDVRILENPSGHIPLYDVKAYGDKDISNYIDS